MAAILLKPPLDVAGWCYFEVAPIMPFPFLRASALFLSIRNASSVVVGL